MTKEVKIKESRVEVLLLNYSLQLADRKLTELKIRRPSIKELYLYQKNNSDGDVEKEFDFFASLCEGGLRGTDVAELESGDYMRLQQLFSSFRAVP